MTFQGGRTSCLRFYPFVFSNWEYLSLLNFLFFICLILFFPFVFSDWENLPKDLLDLVLERLELISDYLAFSVVCKTWNGVAKNNRSQSLTHSSNALNFLTKKIHGT